MHVQPERKGNIGFIQALQHVHTLTDKPDLILIGGDMVFSSYEKPRDRTDLQWSLFLNAVKDHCRLPVRYCLGNHDIWGWNKAESRTTGTEADWGKSLASRLLGVPNWFYAEDFGAWKLIVLDSVQPLSETSYQGRLDDAQMAWLEAELSATPSQKPIVVLTHIPVFHASALLVDGRVREDGRQLGPGAIMTNCGAVATLLARYPNVRTVLQGHIHMVERIDYAGIAWINSGAVSGAWWQSQAASQAFFLKRRGPTPDTRVNRADPGYGLIDLYEGDRVEWAYDSFGWTPIDDG